MHLSHLDTDISPTILRRAAEYADAGLILSLDADGLTAGTEDPRRSVRYQARVRGSRPYQVSIEARPDGAVLAFSCSCPYDGPVCKHVAAVLLVLRDHEGEPPSSSMGPDGARVSRIEELLADQPRDVLANLLITLAARSPLVAQQIRMVFGPRDPTETLSECRRLLRETINLHTDGYGFLEYEAVGAVVNGSTPVADLAASVAAQDPVLAIDIYLLLVEEMVTLLQTADDSDGLVGGAIEDALAAIDAVIGDEALSADTKERAFEHLLAAAGRPFLADWPDWEVGIASMASRLVGSAAMREEWERALLDGRGGRVDSYRSEQLDILLHTLTLRLEGPEEADAFLLDRHHHPTFREVAIRDALNGGRYDDAIVLADAGIEADLPRNLWGLVARWRQLKYEAALQSGQEELTRQTARELFLGGQTEYYEALRSTYPEKAWEGVWRGMLDELDRKPGWPGTPYLHVIAVEHDTPRILEYCRRNPRALEQFLGDLLPTHRDEVAELWRHDIERHGEMASTRTAYQAIAQSLRRMAKAGLSDEARELTDRLLTQYPRKSALREELRGS